jgi:hypothetical protein
VSEQRLATRVGKLEEVRCYRDRVMAEKGIETNASVARRPFRLDTRLRQAPLQIRCRDAAWPSPQQLTTRRGGQSACGFAGFAGAVRSHGAAAAGVESAANFGRQPVARRQPP